MTLLLSCLTSTLIHFSPSSLWFLSPCSMSVSFSAKFSKSRMTERAARWWTISSHVSRGASSELQRTHRSMLTSQDIGLDPSRPWITDRHGTCTTWCWINYYGYMFYVLLLGNSILVFNKCLQEQRQIGIQDQWNHPSPVVMLGKEDHLEGRVKWGRMRKTFIKRQEFRGNM